MLDPVFSIVTPTFNCDRYILRSYFYLSSQSETSWEWILVDDGSNDDTENVVKKINDERISFIRYKTNRGRGFARNLALSQTKGKIIVIWDIDDIYFPNRLKEIKENISDSDFFVSSALVVDNNLNLKGIRSFNQNDLYTGFVHPTLAFQSSLKDKIVYNESMKAGEDLESMIYLTNKCNGFFYDKPLMLYVEDREINLHKSIVSNISHMLTIKNSFKNKISKISVFNYRKLILLLGIKIFLLRLLRFSPNFYLFTVKFRQMEKKVFVQQEYIHFIRQAQLINKKLYNENL